MKLLILLKRWSFSYPTPTPKIAGKHPKTFQTLALPQNCHIGQKETQINLQKTKIQKSDNEKSFKLKVISQYE